MALKDVETKPLSMAHVRDLADEELATEVGRLEEAQFRLRFRAATQDATAGNPMQFRTIRRNIARLKTVLRERKPV